MDYRTVSELRAVLDPSAGAGKQIGMVGTSGGMHAGPPVARPTARPRRTTSPPCTGVARRRRPVVVAAGLDLRLRARRRPRLAARRGSRLRHPLRARRPTCCSLAQPATTVTLPVVLEAGSRTARGPRAPRPDRAGDVQALEHVRSVPQLLRREGLAAAGDVRASRRGPRVPGRGARLPDRPRRRRRRGVEPQLAAHARAARGRARALPGALRASRDAALAGTTTAAKVEQVFTDAIDGAAADPVLRGGRRSDHDAARGALRIGAPPGVDRAG